MRPQLVRGSCAVALVLVAILVLACTPWRTQYLADEVNKATQDDVAKRLGAPNATQVLGNGETVWTYRYDKEAKDESAIHIELSISLSGKPKCVEYILTFDQQRILRNWTRHGCDNP
jgi:hypothetical protein